MHPLLETATAVVALALLVASTAWAARRCTPVRLAAFAACGLLWLDANTPVEGAVLWTVSQGHGLTVADLALPAAACAVLGSWWRRAAPGRRRAVLGERHGRPEGERVGGR